MSKTDRSEQGRVDLFDKYVIFVTTDCYTLGMTGTSKNGKEWVRNLGYFGSMEKALIHCKRDYARRQLIKHGASSLDEAISIIVRSNNHFESLIKNAFEEIAT